MARFEISPERSVVVIDARSSVHPIHAECKGLEGFLELVLSDDGRLDPAGEPKGHLELPVDRLQSGNPLYDREMKRRIDARRYPSITGELTAMAPGDAPGSYRLAGDLSFHGVTKSYEDTVTLARPAPDTLQLEGTHTFDVRDFGVEPPKIMMLRVYPDVTVTVRIVAEGRV